MVARSSSGEDGAPATDPITTSLAAKRQRKAALAGALHGRRVPQQQRDTAGRYTRTAAGFDGGARQPAPLRRNPQAEHNRWLGRVMGSGRASSRGWW
jgi:hypothetical protein